MNKKGIIYIVLGIALTIFFIALYNALWSKPTYNTTGDITELNNEISMQRTNAIVMAAKRITPTVVSISVIQTRVVATAPFFSPYSDDLFRDFFRDFFPERYHREQVKSLGTGLVISSDGYILTNEHVIADAENIRVTLPNGKQMNGEVITQDRTMDLALIKIEAQNLPFAELGNSDNLMIGEWVIAFGNPFGFLLEDASPTVTVGVVSALNRSIKSSYEDRTYKNMIQTDAAINPGNSGGPLVNVLGQVIGINNFIFTSSGGSEGIGFARPINTVKKFIAEAKSHGHIRPVWIGLWLQNITPDLAKDLGIPEIGVVVSNIDIQSPADKAGLKINDRIVELKGHRINRLSDWDRVIADVFVDDELEVVFFRKKEAHTTMIKVEELTLSINKNERVGLYVENINASLAKKYNINYREGVVVQKVEKDGIGYRLGIIPGDVILKIDNTRIRNRNDFDKALESSRIGYFVIDRNGLILQLYIGA